jgi:hypothetical protein
MNFIDQLACKERWEMQRTLDILSGKERPFPCKNLESTIQQINSVPSPSNQNQAT